LDSVFKEVHGWSRVLVYPSLDAEATVRRVVEMKLLGVRRLIEEGRVDIFGKKVLGKGTVGIVVKAVFSGGLYVAVKIRRTDASRETLLKEARILRLVNSVKVGPPLRAFSRNFLVWDYVDGMPLDEWAITASASELRRVIRLVLEQLWRLDTIGVSHNELSRFKDHILVGKNGTPVIVDFESATTGKYYSNLPQFLSFLLNEKSKIAEIVLSKLSFTAKRDELIDALRCYKKGATGIEDILSLLRL